MEHEVEAHLLEKLVSLTFSIEAVAMGRKAIQVAPLTPGASILAGFQVSVVEPEYLS